MTTSQFDVVIIGGGIHGTGAAQAAVAAGYSVLVLEQTGLASGTSSRSSKLIHGGLRYLESAQFGLVRECLQERALLLKNAPDLVRLTPFYIPIYPDTSRRPWQIRSGLSLYTALGGLSEETRFKQIPKRDWAQLDGLDTKNLEKVFRYFDGQTDDAALTRAVMRSAQSLGTVLEMPARFIKAERHNKHYVVDYETDNQQKQVQAGLLINAAGPWVNHVLERVTPQVKALDIELVQGTHIVLDGNANKGIFYVEAPSDKRAVFVMPWQDKIMVGTTETVFNGEPSQVMPLPAEKHYLYETLSHYFPVYRSKSEEQITSAFAGLRVLPRLAGSAFSRPRDTILHTDDPLDPRLVTIYGGKLTAYRATSEKLITRFKSVLPDKKPIADTRALPLAPD